MGRPCCHHCCLPLARGPLAGGQEELEEAGVPHRKVVSEGGVLTHLFLASKESLNMLQDYHQAILLDCTYKTNIFEMPLLEIVGITSTGKSFTAACAFMRGETAPDYVWAMECFREALNGSEVHVLSTDKDDALAAAIAQVFPGADHLLCRWHVNKNVAAKCKPIFGDGERWDSFLKLFNAVCASPTADEYELRLMALLDAESGEDWAAAVRYVRSEWLSHKEKIVAAWTSLLLHFETTATSRVEGAHAALKRMGRPSFFGLSAASVPGVGERARHADHPATARDVVAASPSRCGPQPPECDMA